MPEAQQRRGGGQAITVASSVGIDYFFFLARTIRHAGHAVNEVYLIPEAAYRAQARSSGPVKVWLRLQMYVLYPLLLLRTGLRSRPGSVFVVSSNTFFAPWMMHLLLGFRRIRVIHMLYDLFPDALEIAGGVDQRSPISRLIGSIARRNLQSCDATVYLGDFLQRHAEARWGPSRRHRVIDISTDLALYEPSFPELDGDGPLVVHYGGQLGHLHDAHSIIAAVRRVHSSELAERIRFNFYVSGAQAAMLRRSLADLPVQVIAAAPSDQWRRDIRGFHIGLVSLSPGGASVCLPSKTYAMMAGGLAILAIAPAWSDLAGLVEGLEAGWVVNNSPHRQAPDPTAADYLADMRRTRPAEQVAEDVLNTLRAVLADRAALEQRRRQAFAGVRQRYGIEALSARWHGLIEEVRQQPPATAVGQRLPQRVP